LDIAKPIFETATKENPDPVVGLQGLTDVKKQIGTIPLVAIGGIDLDNINKVFSAGADSSALISALVRQPRFISSTLRKFLTDFVR
jgi:thiamine-phosphate pyrophosphorylase